MDRSKKVRTLLRPNRWVPKFARAGAVGENLKKGSGTKDEVLTCLCYEQNAMQHLGFVGIRISFDV